MLERHYLLPETEEEYQMLTSCHNLRSFARDFRMWMDRQADKPIKDWPHLDRVISEYWHLAGEHKVRELV